MSENKYRSAIISSIVEVSVVHPLDVYKILYQNNKNYKFMDYIFKNIRFKYRGFVSRALGIIPMRTTFWISQYQS